MHLCKSYVAQGSNGKSVRNKRRKAEQFFDNLAKQNKRKSEAMQHFMMMKCMEMMQARQLAAASAPPQESPVAQLVQLLLTKELKSLNANSENAGANAGATADT